MIILLYLLVGNYYDLQIASQRASEDAITLLTTMSLWAFLFGVLMEWNGLRSLVKGRFNFNWQLLIPTVILSILVFIPNIYWVKWYGVSQDIYPNILLLPETHMILSVLAGTMLVRSFVKK
jgi:amino acid transporter